MNMSRQGKGMVEARLGQSQGKAMKGHQGKVTAKSKQSQGMVKARSRESLVFHNCILFDFADFLIMITLVIFHETTKLAFQNYTNFARKKLTLNNLERIFLLLLCWALTISLIIETQKPGTHHQTILLHLCLICELCETYDTF